MAIRVGLLALGAAASLTLSTAVAIADSKYEAKALGKVAFRAGPGWQYHVIGSLKDGAKFRLRTCTSEQGWCLVVNDDREPLGWAQADSLSGVSAKAQVTPWRPFLEPMKDAWFARHRRSEP